MKKVSLLALLMALVLFSCGCTAQEGETVIVTSFYPMYVLTQNIAKDIDGVQVVNMADQNVGCLHDYQLQTRDMVTLEGADALVINGGGMEQFMDKVISMRSDLPVITACEGIDMLPLTGHAHEHEHEHEHEGEACSEVNAHVWLDPQLALKQIENITEGLCAADPAHAEAYRANAADYALRIGELDTQMRTELAPVAGEKIITFHEAFPYFANAFGIEIAGVIEHD